MPLLQEENTNPNPQTDSANQNSTSTHQNQTQSNANLPKSQGLFSLPPSVMNLVPWIPLMLEMTTGQKIPQMSGTIGEIQQGINQIQLTLVQVIQNQQNQNQRLISLESSATNHLTNLIHQFNSLRLTHTREKKEIAYHNQPETKQLNSQNQDY